MVPEVELPELEFDPELPFRFFAFPFRMGLPEPESPAVVVPEFLWPERLAEA